MIKRIREIIASPIIMVSIVIGMILGAPAKWIYGAGYDEHILSIINDINRWIYNKKNKHEYRGKPFKKG